MHLLWGGTPENGVTAQEDTAATTIPFEGKIITEGGNYEIQAGPYTGKIVINTTPLKVMLHSVILILLSMWKMQES